ncbi:MAG: DUF4082 domain-containing protein [Isosphaeraceae bacterium]
MRLKTRPRRGSTARRFHLQVDLLEGRELMTSTAGAATVILPSYQLVRPNAGSTPPFGAYTPAQVRDAYGFSSISFNGVQGDGSGQTIAIVNAYDSPNVQADLDTFSRQFGLPLTTVTRVNQNGGASYPSVDSTGGWTLETALDVQWAHAIAPGANILLVEANSPTDADLLAAVDYASSHANVVSMSWGGGEFSGETSLSYESHFQRAGVVFVSASGDNGAPVSWPSSSPYVLSVGGTALSIASGNVWAGETGWSGSGGGPSAYESQPAYQKGVVKQTTTRRAGPDVAYDGSPSTGFAVYDSYSSGGWVQVGGTSAGSPQWAALVAIADQGRALNGKAAINATSSQEIFTLLYKAAGTSVFHDVTSGSSAGKPSYSASAGFDYVTGLGSPVADLLVPSLAGSSSTTTTPDTLVVSAPTNGVAGASFQITVTAKGSGGTTDAGYRGTVHFTSSDVQAGLPTDYTFTSADAGVHTFTVTLKTAGSRSVTVTDTSSTTTTAGASVTVSPAAASQFILSGGASSVGAGTPLSFTITAKDAYGNVATGYTGTVHVSSTDTAATLPSDYTFTGADAGVHTFSLTFATAGSQTARFDSTTGLITVTSNSVSVTPAAPTSLTASAGSSSQINLSWAGAAGASGYSVERSANGSSGWTQVGTTSGTTTSYQDSGLTAGTTYYYRVRATGGGQNSAYSNTASATTASSTTPPPTASTATSLWDSSYTPQTDSYSYGSYELGLHFTASAAGSVTGVRFYKQSWMNGYTHVGRLWSSSGTLLATAKFTGETKSGWQQVTFSSPVKITPGAVYTVSFSTGGGYFGISSTYFVGAGQDNGPLHAPADGGSAGSNGVYSTSMGKFPTVGGRGMNFWVDALFVASPTTSLVKSAATVTPARVTTTIDYNAPTTTTTTTTQGGSGSTSVPVKPKPTGPSFPNWFPRRGVTDQIPFNTARPRF